MKHCFAAIMAVTLLFSCSQEESLHVMPDTPADPSVDVADNYVYGEARVYLSEEMTAMVEAAAETGSLATKSPGMNLAIDELGITEMYRLFPHAGEFEERTRRECLHRWYVVKYSQEVRLTKANNSL